MTWGLSRIVKSWFFAAICLACAVPAAARDIADVSCHAYSEEAMSVAEARANLDWTCDDSGWQGGAKFAWLYFDGIDSAQPPRFFASRITVFESATIAALGETGTLAQRTYSAADAVPVSAGPVFTLPLPGDPAQAEAYVVAIERPHSITVASEAGLYRDPGDAAGSLASVLLLAVITGMLIMPLLFDSLFYLVLRERFVLLHAAMTVAMIAYVLTSGGVVTGLVALPVTLLAIAGPLAWALGVGFGGWFIVEFLEPEALPRQMRKLLLALAVWAMVVPGLAALQLELTQGFDNRLYFYAFIPVIPAYFAALLYALARGSRGARFLALAWFPVILASLDRLLRGLGVYVSDNSIDATLFVALACEVTIVALAVADRFIAIRRERDDALSAARSLEELSERDALTGLLNRRGIEARFSRLRAQGFTTLAVLDLDHFKLVNDRHGHSIGDDVLRCVASALRGDDRNSLAFRMGGEEFVLLLRGRRTLERAEQRRKAITGFAEESRTIPDRVTASMGIVDAPQDALPNVDFAELYARADRLLYEAKAAGRDRTMSERLKVFTLRRNRERRAAA